MQKTNQLRESKLNHDSGILPTENDTFSDKYDIVWTSSKQKNDYYYKETKIKSDIDGLIKVRNSYPNKHIIDT